ncbi:hypothetical protein [Bradyrhizobium sp.]|uniref:hypothetical protein n=1 Tax=Bradyrhizobium sp. TaxID=376 RepID=UPI004037B860
MPIGRYFFYIGSVLLALLFVANWYLPQPGAGAARSAVEPPTIRIQSAHRWPKPVVIDTTLPTIVPPAATMTTAAPAPQRPGKAAREAYAMATEPPPPKAAEPARPAKPPVRGAKKRTPSNQVAGPETFGYRNDWFAPPRREASASRNETFGSRGFWPMSW